MMICAKVTQGKVVVLLQVSLLLICFVLDCLCSTDKQPQPQQLHLQKLNNLNNNNYNNIYQSNKQQDDLHTKQAASSQADPHEEEQERYYLELDNKLANFHWKAEPAIQVNTNSQINQQNQQPQLKPRTSAQTLSNSEQAEDASELDNGGQQHQVHKHMSKRDLRRVFQVDSHDQVPDYEIITVHPKSISSQRGGHSVHKRSAPSEAGYQLDRTSVENVDTPSNTKQEGEEERELKSENRNINNNQNKNNDDKLIVMELPIFGQDYKLRLKRNVEFQQKIHNMPMFMAETTKDGQLRYTQVDRSNSSSKQQHPQDSLKNHSQPAARVKLEREASWTPIGSTYHDEENLAALLIDQDTRTGHFRVDGTIGNDFVIKPMPASAVEALESHNKKLRLQKQKQEQRKTTDIDNENNNNKQAQDQDGKLNQRQNGQEQQAKMKAAAKELSARDNNGQLVTRPNSGQQINEQQRHSKTPMLGNEAASSSSQIIQLATSTQQSNPKSGQPEGSSSHGGPALSKRDTESQQQQQPAGVGLEHEHDDPHDDDEIFLDEDEAMEMAHQQNKPQQHTKLPLLNNSASNLPQEQARARPNQLSKSASERKWRKYRKLMAQTRVPKANEQHLSPNSSPKEDGPGSRNKRHAAEPEPEMLNVKMTHHIVYRQKPSSGEGHEHSFFALPAEQLRRQQLDGAPSEAQRLATRLVLAQETDQLHDPLGGQFYLEPGHTHSADSAANYDWKLWSRAQNERPFASNSSAAAAQDDELHYANATSSNAHVRHKRHARRGPVPPGHHPHRAPPPPVGGGGGPMRAQGSQLRRKRQAPDTVYPEVLLVVDYDSFLLHGGDSRDVKRYFVSFWNGVDLRYKLLGHPNIRISLAGMIVAKDRDATPYLERNRLRSPNADAVDAAGALTDMGKYLYREDRLPTYDLAVVITKLDMCRRRFDGGRCNRGTAGFAYVGGACVVNKRLEKVNSVAIIEDSGGFSGIIVAAHEVGHLLGCVHDGSPPPNYLGGPGATHCPWEDGFIMSDLRHTERGFRWSHCSVEQFKHFLHGETATCLYNYPHESQMLHRLLPGTMLSLDEQCKRDRGTNACFKDARVCAQLFCFDSASGYCVSYRPAAEGSPCGEGQSCRNGKCVGDVENIITDYSHQSQTVVARRAQPGVAASVVPAVVNMVSSPSGVAASTASLARVPSTSATGGGGDSSIVTASATALASSSSSVSASGITSTTASAPNSVAHSGLASSSPLIMVPEQVSNKQVLTSRMDTPSNYHPKQFQRQQTSDGASSSVLDGHDADIETINNNNNNNEDLTSRNIEEQDQERERDLFGPDQGANLFGGRYSAGASPDQNGLARSHASRAEQQQFSQRSGSLASHKSQPQLAHQPQHQPQAPMKQQQLIPPPSVGANHRQLNGHPTHQQAHLQDINKNRRLQQQHQQQGHPNLYQVGNNLRLHQVTSGLYGSASTNQHSIAMHSSPTPTNNKVAVVSLSHNRPVKQTNNNLDSTSESQKQNYLLHNHTQRQKSQPFTAGVPYNSIAPASPSQEQVARRNDNHEHTSTSSMMADARAQHLTQPKTIFNVQANDNLGDLDDSNSEIDLQYHHLYQINHQQPIVPKHPSKPLRAQQ